ncbi:hypothetical protein FSP39_012178 [Pinctada imbricata]|uniref:Uncharacterized protein n=1 Tax=Pinctada imbricata TaxID=66713 RepID=A0AA89BTI6_PINIB|nr:hypothetical protein FSP39_012178 [Pinctada imbricata]
MWEGRWSPTQASAGGFSPGTPVSSCSLDPLTPTSEPTDMEKHLALAAIILLQSIGLLHSQGNTETRFATNALASVFKQLEDFGEREVAEIKRTNDKFKQFIAFTVLAENEIKQRTAINDNRMHTVKNEKSSGVSNQCDGISCKTQHGEIQAIYKNLFDLEKDKLDKGKGMPYIVLFSHYIPCYGTREVRYSCAEELSNYVYAGSRTFKMIVVFRERYIGTDSEMSIRYMSAERISVYEKVETLKYVDVSARFPSEAILRGNAIFQKTYFDCIKDPDKAYKCHQRCIGDEKHVDMFVAQYVNFATFECTRGKRVSARLSDLTKKSLFECIANYIEENTGSGCRSCTRHTINFKYYLKVCAAFAKEYSTYIGYNKEPTNTYSQTWAVRPMFWKDAYRHDFHELPKGQRAIYCALRSFDVKSLCTKIRRDEHPEKLKLQVRDLNTELKRQLKEKARLLQQK